MGRYAGNTKILFYGEKYESFELGTCLTARNTRMGRYAGNTKILFYGEKYESFELGTCLTASYRQHEVRRSAKAEKYENGPLRGKYGKRFIQ